MSASGRRKLKGAMDIVLAVVGLSLLLVPMGVIACLIVMSDDGAPIFRQERIGRRGERFVCLKFRTMRPGAEEVLAPLLAETARLNGGLWQSEFKSRREEQTTPIGRFLRRTGLDELPQLVNVLNGEMSLVGPRPLTVYESELYPDYVEILGSMRPGIVGLWQVTVKDRELFTQRKELDLVYLSSWSLTGDLMLLLRGSKLSLTQAFAGRNGGRHGDPARQDGDRV